MVNILLIEHDKDFADCLRRILKAESIDVIAVDSVKNALENQNIKDCIASIVDLHDGSCVNYEEVADLREILGDIPILVTVHYQTPDIACKALSKGATDYILKPFSSREIVDRARKITFRGSDGLPNPIEDIASKVKFICNIDDIIKICLDQLVGTLHLTDCLIALRSGLGFQVVASMGYKPDPVGRTIVLSPPTMELLKNDPIDNIALATDGVREIVSILDLSGHRPFPTLMALIDTKKSENEVRGFVMGHGALVLEQEDILEMERFLAEVSKEIDLLPFKLSSEGSSYEGELRLPDLSRYQIIDEIIEKVKPFLNHERDAFWIKLSLEEAITNAIIHGNNEPLENPRTSVIVKYYASHEKLIFVVEDNGCGFDPDNVPDPTAEENLLNVNGRGIFLMRTIMDEVIYNDPGNRVVMVKVLDGKPINVFRHEHAEILNTK